MNTNNYVKNGHRYRPRDAFELYELEHMPRFSVKVSSDHNAKSHNFMPDYYETGGAMQQHWRPQEDGDAKFNGLEHGQERRHKPRDAFEIYELEHVPCAVVMASSDRAKSRDFAKPRELEIFKPDYYETGMQHHWRHTKDGDMGIHNKNIDAEAEDFIASKHEKFELSKWMSMNGY